MINPYIILNLSQDATNLEITKALKIAMKENAKSKKYSIQELRNASDQLMSPEKRLVADFLYPAKIKAKRPKLFEIKVERVSPDLSELKDINADLFDSLEYKIELIKNPTNTSTDINK